MLTITVPAEGCRLPASIAPTSITSVWIAYGVRKTRWVLNNQSGIQDIKKVMIHEERRLRGPFSLPGFLALTS